MAIITYKFADGHTEEIEVTEELKAAFEELDKQEKRYYWKTNKQKKRAELLPTDFSLEQCAEDGHEARSSMPDPLETLISCEAQATYYSKLLSPLTKRQKEVYILRHMIGLNVNDIAQRLNISEKAIRERLSIAYKKTQGIF